MRMTSIIYLVMTLLLVGMSATKANPIPHAADQQMEGMSVDEPIHHAYTESNITYSTLEEILEEIKAKKEESTEELVQPEHIINKRALGCHNTGVAYGSTAGTAFADFTSTDPWPCGVDIIEIRIRSGSLIDAIQLTYKTTDGMIISKPRRGTSGGTERVVRLEEGERITGVTGTSCITPDTNTYITQLVFLSQKEDGQKVVYGPYGNSDPPYRNCRLFAVYGNINSIFGKVSDRYLGAIGFYFEDESRGRQRT